MNPMSDQPVTLAVLTQFYREVMLPDVERVINEIRVTGARRLHATNVALTSRWLDTLDIDYRFAESGLACVEERLDRLDEWRDRASRLEILVAQYEDVRGALQRLDERLRTSEMKIDALGATGDNEALRAKATDFRARVDGLKAQVLALELRLER